MITAASEVTRLHSFLRLSLHVSAAAMTSCCQHDDDDDDDEL